MNGCPWLFHLKGSDCVTPHKCVTRGDVYPLKHNISLHSFGFAVYSKKIQHLTQHLPSQNGGKSQGDMRASRPKTAPSFTPSPFSESSEQHLQSHDNCVGQTMVYNSNWKLWSELTCTTDFSMVMNISTFRSILDGFWKSNLRLPGN